MKYAIRALGGNYEHWRVLHSLARKQAATGVNAWMSRGMGRTRKRSGMTVLFYVFMALMAVNTYFLTTGLMEGLKLFPTTSTLITYQVTSMFVLVTISQVFNELFVSNDDYNNLSFRPIDNRTYFLSKLTAIIVHLYVVAAIMCIPPTIALLIDIRPIECIGYIASNFLLQTGVTLLALTGFMHVASRALTKGKDPKVGIIGGVVAIAMMIPTFWFYFLPKMQTMQFPTEIPIWAEIINPFAWYASIPAVLQGSISMSTLIGSLLATTASVMTYIYFMKYSKLDLLVSVQANRDEAATDIDYARPKKLMDLNLLALPAAFLQNHPMWILFWAHLRANRKFRTTIFGLVFMLVFLLGAPLIAIFAGGANSLDTGFYSASMSLLYMVLMIYCLLMTKGLLLSSEYRASWALFTAPIQLKDLHSFSDRLIRYFVAIPYVVLLFVVCCIYGLTETWFDAFKQVLVFGLFLDLALKVKGGIEVNVPFSQGPEALGKFLTQFVIIFASMILANICSVLIPLCTDQLVGFGASVLVLATLSGVTSLLVRKRVNRRERLLEFVV
ncbi:MAG: hypothetical protein OXG08_00915 [Gammaproteobacteria bacterium]|nr:hypothetical protein [Gammaproteobacteria bacterium]